MQLVGQCGERLARRRHVDADHGRAVPGGDGGDLRADAAGGAGDHDDPPGQRCGGPGRRSGRSAPERLARQRRGRRPTVQDWPSTKAERPSSRKRQRGGQVGRGRRRARRRTRLAVAPRAQLLADRAVDAVEGLRTAFASSPSTSASATSDHASGRRPAPSSPDAAPPAAARGRRCRRSPRASTTRAPIRLVGGRWRLGRSAPERRGRSSRARRICATPSSRVSRPPASEPASDASTTGPSGRSRPRRSTGGSAQAEASGDRLAGAGVEGAFEEPGHHTASRIATTPWPPAAQIETSPRAPGAALVQQLGERGDDASAGRGERVPGGQRGAR